MDVRVPIIAPSDIMWNWTGRLDTHAAKSQDASLFLPNGLSAMASIAVPPNGFILALPGCGAYPTLPTTLDFDGSSNGAANWMLSGQQATMPWVKAPWASIQLKPMDPVGP